MSQKLERNINPQFDDQRTRPAVENIPGKFGSSSLKGKDVRELMGDGIDEEAAARPDSTEKEWLDEYSDDQNLEETSNDSTLGQDSEQPIGGVDSNDYDALELAAAGALNAEDADQFYGRLFSRLRAAVRSPGVVAALGVAKAGQPTGNRTGRLTPRLPHEAAEIISRQILPLLRQYIAYGCDESEALEDLADWFAEEEAFTVLPILGVIAARALVRPLMRRGGFTLTHPAARALVRGGTQAGLSLIRAGGGQALRALPDITRKVLRMASRQQLPIEALPDALRRTVEKVAIQSRPGQRFHPTREAEETQLTEPHVLRIDTPQRLQITGPVEITIVRLKSNGE